jgi:hypothetical protein
LNICFNPGNKHRRKLIIETDLAAAEESGQTIVKAVCGRSGEVRANARRRGETKNCRTRAD